jgi:subtilisin family serine protease
MVESKKDNAPGAGRQARATISAAADAPSNGPPSPTVPAGVAARRERYMVASRPLPGVQPMAADVIANSLTSRADVTIVRRVQPRGFGALSVGGASGGITPEIIVAEMDAATGAALRASAPPNVVVERDALLRHADDLAIASFDNTMTMLPGVGIDIRLRVVGAGGRPLPKATVYVYGLGFPAQGQTDDKGEVTVTLLGGPIETVQAIYVKPAADHWDRMMPRPVLQPNGVNTLQVRPFTDTFQGFPGSGIVGWGQRLMKLDQIDASLGGQGVKIGIVDSGCDNTHPQLRHVTRGVDLTNGGDTASWATDTVMHGTHCAGIITAATNRLQGIRGFAPMAEVHALKVFPGGRFSDLIDALDQCIERNLDIVNLSLGSSDTSELVSRKLVELRQHGVACIVAAGNSSGPVQFPGTEPSVLAVSAIGKLGEFPSDSYHAQTVQPNLTVGTMFSAKFTCFGPQVAVAGPGVAIVSTVPGGGYASWDGTSMATPHVTGMGALVLAHHPLLRDGARVRNEQRVAQLFALLASAGTRYLGDPTREGAGLPDLQRAGLSQQQAGTVQAASAPPPMGGVLSPASVQQLFGNPLFGISVNDSSRNGILAPASTPFPLGFPNQFAAGFNLDPVTMQRLVQLRAAGLL